MRLERLMGREQGTTFSGKYVTEAAYFAQSQVPKEPMCSSNVQKMNLEYSRGIFLGV
jgi:hypothetical protein